MWQFQPCIVLHICIYGLFNGLEINRGKNRCFGGHTYSFKFAIFTSRDSPCTYE